MPMLFLDFVPSMESITCLCILRNMISVVMECLISGTIQIEVPLGENSDIFDIPVDVKNSLWYNSLIKLYSQVLLYMKLNIFKSTWQLFYY